MATVSHTLAFNAFENQLKTLCLKEFPCGLGKWREQKDTTKTKKQQPSTDTQKDLPGHKFSITLRDYGAQHEKTETLEELVTSKQSLWNLDYSWSNEAKELREIAVRSPWLIDDKFVYSHFKTLRITDKGVADVDEKLLQFCNLNELSLSANLLKCVNSRHLPSSLQVLELCANQIWSLSELCIQPPPLIHLGLGYNQISMVDDYITGMYWPQLLSLDMSHNNLCDLMDIVKKLSSLPKLRNLILQGNPLALVAGYRGYTIDSLKLLDILDDIPISADERHHFKGLSKRREYILDEAKLIFDVDFIRGVPMPEETKNPDDQPEFPVISRKYFVQFMFLEDKSSTAEIFHLLHGAHGGLSSTTASQAGHQHPMVGELALTDGTSIAGTHAEDTIGHTDVTDDTAQEKNVNFAATLETLPSAHMPVSGEGSGPGSVSVQDAEEMQHEAQSLSSTPVRLAPIKSDGVDWAEEMEVKWKKWVSRDDLLHLRDFLSMGMDIAIMEEKVESFPAEEDGAPSPTNSSTKAGKSGGKGGKGAAKAEPDKKRSAKSRERTADKKGKSPRSKSADKKEGNVPKSSKDKESKKDPKKVAKDGGKKKKKGEPEVEMTHLPPEYTTLATFHVPMQDFLDGEFEFENVFTKASTESGSTTPASDTHVAGKKDKKDKKKKPDSAKKDKKERGKSPKADKKGDKGGKDKKGAPAVGDGDDEIPAPIPPLQCHVKIKLHHWKTAMDSLRDEQHQQQQQQQSQQ